MQQRPPRISTTARVGGGSSLPSTPQALGSPGPSSGGSMMPGGSSNNRGYPQGPAHGGAPTLATPLPLAAKGQAPSPMPQQPPQQQQQVFQQVHQPTPYSQQGPSAAQLAPGDAHSKPTFSHRRISSFLKASGFREPGARTPNGSARNLGATGATSGGGGGAHKRENSLWSPDLWSNLLSAHNPATVPTADGPDSLTPGGGMEATSRGGVPQPAAAYGSSGRLLHHLEPSPRMQRSGNDYFNGGTGAGGNPNPGAAAPGDLAADPAAARGGGHKRIMSASRIVEYQKASGVKTFGGMGVDAGDPNFLTTTHKPNPQQKTPLPSAFVIRIIVVINIAVSCAYLYWRVTSTIKQIDGHFFGVPFLPVQGWAWTFFAVEVCLVIAIWIGHTQRLFAVQRVKVTMDELVREDDSVGYNSRIAILLPTNGEKLDVVMKALLGCVSLRGWDASVEKCAAQRIIVLDEKRRKGVLNMAAAVYALATIVRHPNVLSILQAEGVQAITAKGFYDWWKEGGGYARKHLYNDHFLNQACRLLEYMEEEAANEAVAMSVFGLEELPAGVKGKHETLRVNKKTTQASANHMLQAMNVGEVNIEPGYVQTFNTNVALPTLIYYTRRDSGTPKVSPKAGNMNAALFSLDYPDMPPLIGNSTIVVVNDCRHQLQPEFLQRTVPYFYELTPDKNRYRWAPVAFVQTPQRFNTAQQTDDPLGNHAAVQYDVINHGKDGIGAVSSSGQGSLWRVAALKGVDATGKQYADINQRGLVGHRLGFRSEMLIEDTHTSIDMFRNGWTSRYVNEPGEHLSMCTHQPNNIAWRIKQVLRWHQGAVQLLFFKGIGFTCWGGKFPTVFHRIYAFDQATYYLQAIPGYMLLLMPIIYGVTGNPPFDTTVGEFFLFFTPFIVTAMLPTVISGSWRGIDSHRLTRDEQVWLSTTYVQIYAFLSMCWQQLRCKGTDDAWAVRAPTWPLFAVFFGEFLAIIGALVWVSQQGFTKWAANLISVIVSACLAIHALWPMVSLQMGWKLPSLYYLKLMAWLIIGVFIVLIYYISK